MTAEEIIQRCTRNGITAWSQVAKQLGQSVDHVRARHDATYMRAYIAMPERGRRREMDLEPEVPLDPVDTSSPHVKPAKLRFRVLAILFRQTASAQTIAALTGTTLGTAKWQLSVMKGEGMIRHDARAPYTWTITVIGRAEFDRLRPANSSVRGVTV